MDWRRRQQKDANKLSALRRFVPEILSIKDRVAAHDLCFSSAQSSVDSLGAPSNRAIDVSSQHAEHIPLRLANVAATTRTHFWPKRSFVIRSSVSACTHACMPACVDNRYPTVLFSALLVPGFYKSREKSSDLNLTGLSLISFRPGCLPSRYMQVSDPRMHVQTVFIPRKGPDKYKMSSLETLLFD